MLTDIKLEKIFMKLGLPESGRQLVREARINSPVRKPTAHLGNSIIDQFSQKMGDKHLTLESRTVESPAATLHEDDNDCLEYWPQPCVENFSVVDSSGKTVTRTCHYPDFLVIRSEKIYLEEWRKESRLIKLAAEGDQFYKDDDGWHYRSAELHFGEMGIIHKVRSDLEIPRALIENSRFLQDYRRRDCPVIPEEIENNLLNIVNEEGSIEFLSLIHEHNFCADNIFKAVADNLIYADLYNSRLHDSINLVLHRDKVIAKAHQIINEDRTPALPIPGMARLAPGAKITFDGKKFEVMLVGGGQVLFKDNHGHNMSLSLDDIQKLFSSNQIEITGCQNPDGSPIKSLADISKEQLAKAQQRLELIENGGEEASERSLQRWQSEINPSMSRVDKLLALVDRNHEKGNRLDRISENAENLAEEAIRKYYNTPTCRTMIATHDKYKELCDEHSEQPMSYPTFTKRIKERGSTRKREGKRKDYQVSPIPLYLDYEAPIHGVYPHEVCYIDHTTINLATRGIEGSELGKPTFTLATDGHTTQPRAMYLSYDPPNKNAVLMVLRDYVRRHNRLPKILVVDGGKEFRSKDLKEFCRIYEIDLRHRPPGMPRGGSPVERALGAAEDEVIACMEGNTRIMKENTRLVTKSVNPFPRAKWTLTAAYGALEEYLFEIKDTRRHPTLGLTPREYENMRIMETGEREHTLVKFDQNIMIMTCPRTTRQFHVIDPIRGVWVDGRHHWHDDFRNARKGDKVETRPEPWCANVAYVYYNNRWIAAIVRDLRPLHGRTSREAQLALRVERRKAKVNANKDRLSQSSSKKMIVLWDPTNFDERIGKQQREMEHLYSRLGMTVAIPQDQISSKADVLASPEPPVSETHFSTDDKISELSTPAIELVEESLDESFWGTIDGYS